MVLLEVCVDSVGGAKAARKAGAARVELCTNLLEGGVTPSAGLMCKVKEVCCAPVVEHAADNLDSTSNTVMPMRLHVLVRPRGGDFIYSEDEIQVALEDIRQCAGLGADGVVVGALTPEGAVHQRHTALMLGEARRLGLDVTFHRAFDMCADQRAALDQLIALGAPRVLTSGGQPSALQGAGVLGDLVAAAAGRISVLAGGGVTAGNVAQLVAVTGVKEVHSSAKRKVCSTMQYRRPGMSMVASRPPSDWEWNEAHGQEVAAIMAALSGLKPS